MDRLLVEKAAEILRANDFGGYTVPTRGLYPFQWNWDSCLTAIGLGNLDENRAWTEIETLFRHQWDDGMVPHIVFHGEDEDYFPGPDVWGTGKHPSTSGITNPPVAGFAVRQLVQRAKDKETAVRRGRALLSRIARWHDWFYRCRDPENTGLVAVIHPWETGRDNSIDWDDAFSRVPVDGVAPFERTDIRHADPAHRPTREQYQRYIWLVQHFRSLDWDNEKLHEASPFKIVDPGFNGILIRSACDLAEVADQFGANEIAEQLQGQAKRTLAAMDSLWSEEHGQYLCFDRSAGKLIDSLSVGGLLASFAKIPDEHVHDIARRIEKMGENAVYLVPSHDPYAETFDPLRYWRGPAWIIANYMIANGMEQAGERELAERIRKDSVELIKKSGFAEYYSPMDGTPCGGSEFSWTAAMVIELLQGERE